MRTLLSVLAIIMGLTTCAQAGDDAPFSFLGVTFNDASGTKGWKFQILNKAPIPGHPELTLVVGTPSFGSGVFVLVTQRNGKNIGLIYTFPFTQSRQIEAGLIQSYNSPANMHETTWQTAYGQMVQGVEMIWETSAGEMVFDDRSEDLSQGKIVINPTEALDGNAARRGIPTTNFH